MKLLISVKPFSKRSQKRGAAGLTRRQEKPKPGPHEGETRKEERGTKKDTKVPTAQAREAEGQRATRKKKGEEARGEEAYGEKGAKTGAKKREVEATARGRGNKGTTMKAQAKHESTSKKKTLTGARASQAPPEDWPQARPEPSWVVQALKAPTRGSASDPRRKGTASTLRDLAGCDTPFIFLFLSFLTLIRRLRRYLCAV